MKTLIKIIGLVTCLSITAVNAEPEIIATNVRHGQTDIICFYPGEAPVTSLGVTDLSINNFNGVIKYTFNNVDYYVNSKDCIVRYIH